MRLAAIERRQSGVTTMRKFPDFAAFPKLTTTRKVKLIVVLFVFIAILLTSLIQLQGNIANGVRSYVRGEGLWAKAQKDAVLHLYHYSYSRSDADLQAFRNSMEVFQGDSDARRALEQSTPDETRARAGFIEGRNSPEDIDSLIWFFLHFQNVSYMRDAIGIWEVADLRMYELMAMAEQMHADIRAGRADAQRFGLYREQLQALSVELNVLENRFSYVLGEGARWVKSTVWLASLAVLLISISMGLLVSRQIILSIGRAERELLSSESRFRSLKESNTIGIASWNMNGQFTDANDLLLNMLGYTRAELEAGAFDWRAMTPPEFQARDQQAIQDLANKGCCAPFEKVLLHKNGTRVPIYLGASMIEGDPNNGIAYFLDMSERKQAEAQLRLASVVFDSSSNGVLITDSSMRILSVNKALCQMTGYCEEELAGKTPRILHSGYTTAEQFQTIWNSLLNKGHWHGDIIDRSKSGELLPLSVSISSVLDQERKNTHYVVIMNDISERKAEEAHLWHMAHHDTLTGLPNRTLFNDRIEQLIKQTGRNGGKFAVLFYDLDKFKPVNDRYGHEAGDKLLRAVANRLKMHVRDTDTITRLGGDEFVILLASISGRDAAEQLLRQTVAAVCAPCEIDGHNIEISVSAGLSIYPDDGTDRQSLINHADNAMYGMKQKGAENEKPSAAHQAM